MSNQYCVGVIGFRNGCITKNTISFDKIKYEFLLHVNPKRFLSDVKNVPQFTLRPSENNTNLKLYFNPWTGEKTNNDMAKRRIVEQFFDLSAISDVERDGSSSEFTSENVPPSAVVVYSMLHDAHEQEGAINQEIKLPKFFLPILRPYQSKAVQWMLQRERVSCEQVQEFVPVKCHSIPNTMFYFNNLTSELLDYEPHKTIPTGGILADEMGLGKTVEILALILSNPNVKRKFNDDHDQPVAFTQSVQKKMRCLCNGTSNANVIECSKCSHWQHMKCVAKYSDQPILNYICPECWELERPVHSTATFIACPASIKNQWKKEIRKHISSSSFKIFDYNGVKQNGWISPRDLAEYDVVLCDYIALRSEIHYANRNETYNTRSKAKGHKFIFPKSPLTKVHWWRIVLDEAQMVETPSNQCSKMVKILPAVHRWAVTGTPIEKSINDLYGLVAFLDYEPYTERNIWNKLTAAFDKGDVRPLIDQCLKKIMWRTSKINVLTEMQLPQQQEIVHKVQMKELEARFYFVEHSKCESEFNRVVGRLTSSTNELQMNERILKLIMEPLRKLRRDCTVPTVVETIDEIRVQRIISSPAELYEHLLKENEDACKHRLKIIARCSSGLATWYLNNDDVNAAVEIYKHVLSLVKGCTDLVHFTSMKPLQNLHNLLNITKLCNPKSETKTECMREIERLERFHLEPINNALKATWEKQTKLENDIEALTNDSEICWWNYFDTETEAVIVDKVRQQIANKLAGITSFHKIRDILNSWVNNIEAVRRNLKKVFNEHNFSTTTMEPPILLSEKILKQIDDHNVDNADNDKNAIHDPLCLLCLKHNVKQVLGNYECLIYNSSQRHTVSYQEIMLRAIETFMLNEPMNVNRMIETSKKHFELIQLQKMEFEEYEKYLQQIDKGVKVLNKLRIDSQTNDPFEFGTEFEYQKLRLTKQRADENFNKHFNILKYLTHLKANIEHSDGECPICFELLMETEYVLECGHKMCYTCFGRIRKIHPIQYTCHSCRNIQSMSNVYQVFRKNSTNTALLPGTKVIGNYSNKILEIVRTALNLKASDPDVKIIIFSHWNDILKLIAGALSKNGIQNRTKSYKFDKCIDEFKDKDKKVTCLLLPLACGSKGLNLIEATHIFLVEPILNPAEESQAISRIHRIGQTKPTFVHRFIVLNTIEETIFTTVSKDMVGKWKTTGVTVDNLKGLFTQHRQIN